MRNVSTEMGDCQQQPLSCSSYKLKMTRKMNNEQLFASSKLKDSTVKTRFFGELTNRPWKTYLKMTSKPSVIMYRRHSSIPPKMSWATNKKRERRTGS